MARRVMSGCDSRAFVWVCLQVSGRATQMLRERLAQREQRISELKAAVAAAQPDLAGAARQLAANTSVTAVRVQAATAPQTVAQPSASAADGDPRTDRRSVAIQAGSASELAATAPGPQQGTEQEQRAIMLGQAADQTHALAEASPACILQEIEARADSSHTCPGAGSRITLHHPEDIPAEPKTQRPHPAAPEPQSPNAKRSSRDTMALILHGGPDSTGAPAAASIGSPQRELAEAVADLRLELACRDAEIEHLQGTLTQVVAASQAEANRPSSAASAYEQVRTTKDFLLPA